MLTNEELAAIEARANVAMREGWAYQLDESVRDDIPALLAEVRRLREELSRAIDAGIGMGQIEINAKKPQEADDANES